MPRALPATDLLEEYDEMVTLVENDDELTLIRASPSFEGQVHLHDYSLPETIELARDLGIDVFYVAMEKADDGLPEWTRIFFLHEGSAHTQYIESEELAQIRAAETEGEVDEIERKRSLADELLETYPDLLSDAQKYRLKNNVADMRMDRLFQLQDRLQQEKEQKEREERIDEELELELAQTLFEGERFNRQFNEMDTEMLLREMDVEFDEQSVRIGEIHRQAKSLIKVNQ